MAETERRNYNILLEAIRNMRAELIKSQQDIRNEIIDRMQLSHVENRQAWADHRNRDHGEIKEWQDGHFGQADDTVHAIIDKRLSAHSKRFWITWLSGASAAIAAAWAIFTEWTRRNH